MEKFNIRCNSNFLNHTYVGIIYKIYLYLKKKKKSKCSKLCKQKPYQHIFQKQNVIYLRKIQFTANIVLLEAWFNNHSVIFYIFDVLVAEGEIGTPDLPFSLLFSPIWKRLRQDFVESRSCWFRRVGRDSWILLSFVKGK